MPRKIGMDDDFVTLTPNFSTRIAMCSGRICKKHIFFLERSYYVPSNNRNEYGKYCCAFKCFSEKK